MRGGVQEFEEFKEFKEFRSSRRGGGSQESESGSQEAIRP
jgi:hypothetical protein